MLVAVRIFCGYKIDMGCVTVPTVRRRIHHCWLRICSLGAFRDRKFRVLCVNMVMLETLSLRDLKIGPDYIHDP